MRPPVVAGPRARAARPPKVLSSISVFSGAAGTARAARAPGRARPNPAARRQGIHFAFRCMALLLGLRRPLLLFDLLDLGHGESGVVDAGVDLDLLDGDGHARRRALGFGLEREREDEPFDRLVVAHGALELDFLTAHVALALFPD